jgi:general secretion pathway protein I
MNRRAFTLVEVLISLAMFALAAISLGAAYTNVVLSRQALKVNDVAVDDLARARAALLETVNYDDVTTGGEINLPGDRVATWKGEIEPTSVSDLFSVTLTVEIQNADGTDAAPLTETRLLLRPTWSVPADRQKIRDAARQRLATERGYTETTGGDYTAVRSAPTPSNKTAWNHATPGDAGGKRPGAATNDKGKAGTTPTPTRGNATKPGATPANGKPGAAPTGGKTPPRPAAPAPKPVIQ